MLSFYHSLALHTELEKTRTPNLLEWGWLYDILDMDLKNTQSTLRDSVWFFDILDLKSARTTLTGVRFILWNSGRGLKNTWTSWLDSDFILHWTWVVDWLNELIKQELLLEKYEDVLELSIKQYVMQLSPTSLGQIMCDLWKTYMMLVTKLVIFCIELDLCLSKSNPIPF